MKEYFKHDKGYLLINEEAFFLTSSGNWSEAIGLTEKSISSIQKNSRRADRMYYFAGTLLVTCLYAFYSKRIVAGIGGLTLVYFVWNYLKNDTTFRCKIPQIKLLEIEILEQKNVVFRFVNEKGNSDFESIQNLEPKGILFLEVNFNKFLPT